MDRCITAEYILRSGFDLPPAQARSASGLGVKKMTHGARPDGQLLDASEITWFNDPDDAQPIQPTPPTAPTPSVQEGRSRPHRTTAGTRLAEAIAAEKLDEFGKPTPSSRRLNPPLRAHPRPSAKRKRTAGDVTGPVVIDTDVEDKSFTSGSDGLSDDDSDIMDLEIGNEELADMLPSKTIPETRKGHALKSKTRAKTTAAAAKKARLNPVEDEDIEDDGPLHNSGNASGQSTARSTLSISPASSFSGSNPKNASFTMGRSMKKNPIYLFYEVVANGSDGTPGDEGDVHYRCLHGTHKVCTIKRSMRSNLGVLINYLRVHVKPMHRLYCVLKDRHSPPTPDEVAYATGQKKLDGHTEAEYFNKLEKVSENIKKAFEDQKARTVGAWNQGTFERLLIEWVVACDQPFDEVERPEFVKLMNFTRHSGIPLNIPKRAGIKRRIMAMGEETTRSVHDMFSELEGKVALSLDAWTSSNGHAFLAIVAHYVTNSGKLDELLIDFQELIGKHSGENMAETVWATMEKYNLVGRVIAIVMDNASNNNTLMVSLEKRCNERRVPFSATNARMRCLPHTVHLAAIKLLEGIGAMSKADGQKASVRSVNYQDNITTPLDRIYDNDTMAIDEIEDLDLDCDMKTGHTADGVMPAIEKLRKIVKDTRSSPQKRQLWVREIDFIKGNSDGNTISKHMLILDVKTRWASTHQMLRRALDYQETINSYVSRNKEMHAFELSNTDWESIKMVTSWLKSFRVATTEMSATKTPMLSTTHAIFRGLQDDIKNILRSLPDTVSPNIILGLTDAHRKLSDYYYEFDASPFYTWAALLDPRISYEGLKIDYADDLMLSSHLEKSKTKLFKHFNENYANRSCSIPLPAPSAVTQAAPFDDGGSPKKSFTARYRRKEKSSINELEEYFKLNSEDFDTCDPIHWWMGRRAQFPNLFCMARDILCIPGSAVAVERIFSGGRDTISLRRSSLHADTIRTLMLVKKQLHLAREKAN